MLSVQRMGCGYGGGGGSGDNYGCDGSNGMCMYLNDTI